MNFRGSITGLCNSLSTLRAGISTDDARLASGGWSGLPGGSEPAGFDLRISIADLYFHLICCFHFYFSDFPTHRAVDGATQIFMRSLQQTIDLYGLSVDDFLKYKEMLIDYLERFIGELVTATNQIAIKLNRFEPALMELAFDGLTRRELIDALDPTEVLRKERRMAWQRRWQGLRRWFLGDAGKSSQAEILRQKARSAIPALLATLANINDRRSTRSDRATDWKTLAGWFAEADTEDDLHRLWRTAFSLSPSRHYMINSETLDRREEHPVPAKTSWLEAEPVWITPRLRQSGRSVARGPAKSVLDRREGKAAIKKLNEEETRQISEARRVLATNQRTRLSEIAALDPHTFDLLLDLLGEALSQKTEPDESVLAPSTDGSLVIHLEPIIDSSWVAIRTSEGELSGFDHWVTIRGSFQASA
tara:strand:+ start:1706 stop:2965 length:1260 start_codon:yes stop_codon:yes gene_type:complete